MQSNEKPHLIMTSGKGEPTAYHCSLCGQLFLLPDDRSPEEADAELLAAFQEHVGERTCRRGEGLSSMNTSRLYSRFPAGGVGLALLLLRMVDGV